MRFCYFVLLLVSGLMFSQETIIPYRNGNQWGFASTSGKVVLKPIYDSIEPLDYLSIYRVYKGKKEGVVKQGKEVVSPIYDFVFQKDSRFLIGNNRANGGYTVGDSRETVYNLRGEKILDHIVMDVKLVESQIVKGDNLFITWGVEDNSGLFLYDDKLQKVKTWLLKDLKGVLEFCGFSKQKNEIYICQYAEPSIRYAIKYSSKLKKYQVTKLTGKVELPEITFDDGMGNGSGIGLYGTKNNYLLRTFEYSVNQGKITLERKDQRYKEGNYKKEILNWSSEYDEIVLNKYIQGNGVELYQHDSSPYNSDEIEKIDSVFQYKNYVTFKKDGKIGLLAENKIIEPKFQTIKYFSIGRTKPYFLVSVADSKSSLKYGVINSEGKIILPIIYDEIKYNTGGGYSKLWIIKSGNKYGVASSNGKVLKIPQYDSVEPNELFHSVNLIKDKKYGYYNIDDDFCEPVLPNKAVFVFPFNKQKFLKLVDDRGKFLGYADFKGRVYFEN